MGETIDTGLKGRAYASMSNVSLWTNLSNICSYVQKHTDTIRQFQIIKKVHVESLNHVNVPIPIINM